MTRPKLVLIGAGGHARACIDVLEDHGGYEIAGLVGTANEVEANCLGYPIVGTDAELPQLSKSHGYALVTVGQIRSAALRTDLYELATRLGFVLPSVIARTAHVSRHATIGPGTIVMHRAVVNAGATVGRNCIVNTAAIVEHDVVIGDHCHISTGAILNGGVRVAAGSFVGSRAAIREGVSIGPRCVIGMGLAVRHDQPADAVFVGEGRS